MAADMTHAKQTLRRDSLKQFLSAFGMSQDKTRRALELQATRSAQHSSRAPEGADREKRAHEQGSPAKPPARGP